MVLVLEPWKELGVSQGTLGDLVLGGWSWKLLEGGFSSFLSLPFQFL